MSRRKTEQFKSSRKIYKNQEEANRQRERRVDHTWHHLALANCFPLGPIAIRRCDSHIPRKIYDEYHEVQPKLANYNGHMCCSYMADSIYNIINYIYICIFILFDQSTRFFKPYRHYESKTPTLGAFWRYFSSLLRGTSTRSRNASKIRFVIRNLATFVKVSLPCSVSISLILSLWQSFPLFIERFAMQRLISL